MRQTNLWPLRRVSQPCAMSVVGVVKLKTGKLQNTCVPFHVNAPRTVRTAPLVNSSFYFFPNSVPLIMCSTFAAFLTSHLYRVRQRGLDSLGGLTWIGSSRKGVAQL